MPSRDARASLRTCSAYFPSPAHVTVTLLTQSRRRGLSRPFRTRTTTKLNPLVSNSCNHESVVGSGVGIQYSQAPHTCCHRTEARLRLHDQVLRDSSARRWWTWPEMCSAGCVCSMRSVTSRGICPRYCLSRTVDHAPNRLVRVGVSPRARFLGLEPPRNAILRSAVCKTDVAEQIEVVDSCCSARLE